MPGPACCASGKRHACACAGRQPRRPKSGRLWLTSSRRLKQGLKPQRRLVHSCMPQPPRCGMSPDDLHAGAACMQLSSSRSHGASLLILVNIPCSTRPMRSSTARRSCATSWTAASRCLHLCMGSVSWERLDRMYGWAARQHIPCVPQLKSSCCLGPAQANHQLDGALEFLSALGSEPLETNAFEDASGVGVKVSQHPSPTANGQ
jgi:hypothetical protein